MISFAVCIDFSKVSPGKPIIICKPNAKPFLESLQRLVSHLQPYALAPLSEHFLIHALNPKFNGFDPMSF
jgi:hypothetical protein